MAGVLLASDVARRQRVETVIEALLPETSIPTPTALLQARRNAQARESLMREFGGVTSAEVAEWAGSKARNRAALANRWKQEGRIFAVTYRGETYFPGFQFDADGRPRKVMATVIDTLGKASTGWELALWFTSPTGWLGGRRPVDLLQGEPELVVEAATREAAELDF